jgi:pyridoxal phosphate enzyme (YggS family)
MGAVAANLASVQRRIADACRRVDRDPGEVRLLPVTKTHGPDLLREAYDAGMRIFGENRVQEAAEKAEIFADREDLHWALIGPLQSNKARRAAELASEFHALDSTKIAYALDRRLAELGRSLDVFIQVNSSDEDQKSGLPPAEVVPFARELASCASLRVRGVMTLAVFSDDAEAVAACFDRTRQVQQELRDTDGLPGSYDELSMGMSGDFELAIEHGATTVRVGQAIFGPR